MNKVKLISCILAPALTYSIAIASSTEYEYGWDKVFSESMQKSINDYNNVYKTSIKNRDELLRDSFLRIRNYYSNLRECKPGSYQYARVMPAATYILFATSTIQGNQNDGCLVTTTFQDRQNNFAIQCKFQANDLKLFTDEEAENEIWGMFGGTNDSLMGIKKLDMTACQKSK